MKGEKLNKLLFQLKRMRSDKILKSIKFSGLYYSLLRMRAKLFPNQSENQKKYLLDIKRAYRKLKRNDPEFEAYYLRDILLVNGGRNECSRLSHIRDTLLAKGLTVSSVEYDDYMFCSRFSFAVAVFFNCPDIVTNYDYIESAKTHNKLVLIDTEGKIIDATRNPGHIMYGDIDVLVQYIMGHLSPHIAMVLPSTNISGGVLVALTHATFLQDSGWNVDIFTCKENNALGNGTVFNNHHFYTYSYEENIIEANYDLMIATMWTTVDYVLRYPFAKRKKYFVQSYETNFYAEADQNRLLAEATYCKKGYIEYYTMSQWCKQWLETKFDQKAEYLPNGIYTESFRRSERCFSDKKIRLLIEGDCSVESKNIDESFEISNSLSKDKFEIWYLSYNAFPKEWYRIDRFFHKIPFDEVHKIFEQCDILIKSSTLESFSYPPLEMMATGGFVVVVENEGNAEYIKNENNCLTYPVGDILRGAEAINRICTEKDLREKLYAGACETADSRDWKLLKNRIAEFYNSHINKGYEE